MKVSKSFTITLEEEELKALSLFAKKHENISLAVSIKQYLLNEITKKHPFFIDNTDNLEDITFD